MQIQKDTIRKRILDAALEEFLITGYTQSSMRNIAQQSGITAGNIYSYFSGKDDLFETLMGETVEQLQSLVFMEVPKDVPLTEQGITEMAHSISSVFLENRIQFLILMDGSAGSKYENIKNDLIQLATKRIIFEINSSEAVKLDSVLAEMIAVALIDGMIFLFKKVGGDKKRLEKLVGDFLVIILGDFFSKP